MKIGSISFLKDLVQLPEEIIEVLREKIANYLP